MLTKPSRTPDCVLMDGQLLLWFEEMIDLDNGNLYKMRYSESKSRMEYFSTVFDMWEGYTYLTINVTKLYFQWISDVAEKELLK